MAKLAELNVQEIAAKPKKGEAQTVPIQLDLVKRWKEARQAMKDYEAVMKDIATQAKPEAEAALRQAIAQAGPCASVHVGEGVYWIVPNKYPKIYDNEDGSKLSGLIQEFGQYDFDVKEEWEIPTTLKPEQVEALAKVGIKPKKYLKVGEETHRAIVSDPELAKRFAEKPYFIIPVQAYFSIPEKKGGGA